MKDPAVALCLEMLSRTEEMRKHLDNEDGATHSDTPCANDFQTFSKDHLQVMLCHVFYTARLFRCHGSVGDVPIIWQTKTSERNKHLGRCVLFICEPKTHCPALPVLHNAVSLDASLVCRDFVGVGGQG
jgi:hypothetical protein